MPPDEHSNEFIYLDLSIHGSRAGRLRGRTIVESSSAIHFPLTSTARLWKWPWAMWWAWRWLGLACRVTGAVAGPQIFPASGSVSEGTYRSNKIPTSTTHVEEHLRSIAAFRRLLVTNANGGQGTAGSDTLTDDPPYAAADVVTSQRNSEQGPMQLPRQRMLAFYTTPPAQTQRTNSSSAQIVADRSDLGVAPISPTSHVHSSTEACIMPRGAIQPHQLALSLADMRTTRTSDGGSRSVPSSQYQGLSEPFFVLDLVSGHWLDAKRRIVARVENSPRLLSKMREATQQETDKLLDQTESMAASYILSPPPSLRLSCISILSSGRTVAPTRYRPDPRWNYVYGLVLLLWLSMACIAHMALLPWWMAQVCMAVYACLAVGYAQWIASTAGELSRESKAHNMPMERKVFYLQDSKIHVRTPHRPGSRMFFMNGRISARDAWEYALRVSVNIQLNNLCRFPRFLHGLLVSFWRHGSIRHFDRHTAFYLAMNSSLHRWMADDGNLHFPDVSLWVRDPQGQEASASESQQNLVDCFLRLRSRLLANRGHRFDHVTVVFDYDALEVVRVELDDVVICDPYDMAPVLCLIIAAYSHSAVHMSAVEVDACSDSWPLAKRAHTAANGIAYGAVNVVYQLLLPDREEHARIMYSNAHQPVPHPRGGKIHALLTTHSSTYRVMIRAHADPLVIAAAGGDPMRVSSIVQGSLLHGLDHYIVDLYTSTWLAPKALGGGIGFTAVALMGAGYNTGFTSSYHTPLDPVTERIEEIIGEEEPELVHGFQWAVCQ